MAKESTPAAKAGILRYKGFECHWSDDVNVDLSELPDDTFVEVHPTFILVKAKGGWSVLVPMDRIKYISVSDPMPV